MQASDMASEANRPSRHTHKTRHKHAAVQVARHQSLLEPSAWHLVLVCLLNRLLEGLACCASTSAAASFADNSGLLPCRTTRSAYLLESLLQ